MKSLVQIFEAVLHDCSTRCDVPLTRDLETVTSRVEHEGDSFLTITLPAYCRDFEKSLDSGQIAPTAFLSFRKNGCIPAFLQGYMRQVFDSHGRIRDVPSFDCISAIRQLCLMFKKVVRPCTKERNRLAEEAYIACENEVADDLSDRTYRFQTVCDIVMSHIVPYDFYANLRPSHGGGATAEGIRGNRKYTHRTWHNRLEMVFPFSEFAVSSPRADFESIMPGVHFVEPEDEQPVRVVFVPKTLKTPRVIAVEPVCMQYTQQSLAKLLVGNIESCRLTAGHVNFRDQTVNQKLSRIGSISGKFATLDMSEASDRVSLAMARSLFNVCPDFWAIVEASRSLRAKLPSGLVLDLRKFASMGSAMCFPVEAMVFYCAIISSRLRIANLRATAQNVYKYSRSVYVYGDDLIVPAHEASTISDDLEAFGLRVNRHKSFWNGKFRESCGEDYYAGYRVTPVYLRHDIPTDRADAPRLVSWVATANQLFEAGYYAASTILKEHVEKVVGKLPTIQKTSQAMGWHFFSEECLPRRWNKHLHRREVYTYVPVPKRVPDPLEGDGAMVKSFLLAGQTVSEDHLVRSVEPYTLALKRRWVAP